MSSRVSSTMIFSPVVRDITACRENSIVSMRSQFTMISSPLIFLTTITERHPSHTHFIGNLDHVLQIKINRFEAFCEASRVQVFIQRVDGKTKVGAGTLR